MNFECSTVCPTLLGLMGIWQNRLGSMARWWNAEIKVNPTQVYETMGRFVEGGLFYRYHYSPPAPFSTPPGTLSRCSPREAEEDGAATALEASEAIAPTAAAAAAS